MSPILSIHLVKDDALRVSPLTAHLESADYYMAAGSCYGNVFEVPGSYREDVGGGGSAPLLSDNICKIIIVVSAIELEKKSLQEDKERFKILVRPAC